MHLAIVTHTLSRGDGQGRVNYEVARAALDRGDYVTLIASTVSPELLSYDRVRWVEISVDGWPTALLRNQVFAFRSARWLRQHRDEIDVTLANGFITWAPVQVNAAHFVHSAWLHSEVHTSRLTSGPTAWYQWAYTALNARWERRAFAQAETVIAVSDRVAAELRAAGVPDSRIRTVPNGVDLDEFTPQAAQHEPMNLPVSIGDRRLALFVGDLKTPRKNLDTVLRALVDLPGLHLAVAGRTDGSPYPAEAARLGVASQVTFLGFRRDIAALMRAADVCVCPSRYEPFSLVVLEALASGCPVVTARSVGAAPIVTPACGVVVDDPNDAHTLTEALRRVAVNPSPRERQSLRRAARAAALDYDWSRTAAGYLDVLDATYACPAGCMHEPSRAMASPPFSSSASAPPPSV